MLNYDQIAPAYDQRYKLHDYPGIRATLLELIKGAQKPKVLEVGCGTGKWLRLLAQAGCDVAGLDASNEMLNIALLNLEADLRNGNAENLPWPDGSFDFVLYINALHHFKNPGSALTEAFRVLSSGGKILSIGLDPHERIGKWYVYEFFPAALQLDLGRFPSQTQRRVWLQNVGFTDISVRVAEHLLFIRSYAEAVRDGSLERSFTSQLTALSDQDYSAGIRAIQDRANASAAFRLEVDLLLFATEAQKPIKTNR